MLHQRAPFLQQVDGREAAFISHISEDRLGDQGLSFQICCTAAVSTQTAASLFVSKGREMMESINDLWVLVILQGTSGTRVSPTVISSACKPRSFRLLVRKAFKAGRLLILCYSCCLRCCAAEYWLKPLMGAFQRDSRGTCFDGWVGRAWISREMSLSSLLCTVLTVASRPTRKVADAGPVMWAAFDTWRLLPSQLTCTMLEG